MKKLLALFLAACIALSLCACGSGTEDAEESPEQLILVRRTDTYSPGGAVSFLAHADNKLLMGGGDNLRLCEFKGASISDAQELEYSGGDIWGIYALDGVFYVLADMLYKYSPEGELIEKTDTFPYDRETEHLFSVSVCEAGLVASIGMSFILMEDGSELTLDTSLIGQAPTQGMSGELIIAGANAFFEANLETGEVTELFRHGGLIGLQSVCRLSEDVFVYTLDGDDDLHIASVEETDVSGQSKVRVAILSDGTTFNNGIDRINAESGEYYYEYEMVTHDLLTAQISSGNCPDLVLFSHDAIGRTDENYLFTDTELFEDLYTYIDADPELSRESFIPNFLEAVEVNGRLTQLWSYVEIYTLIARAEDVGDAGQLTTADYTRIFEGSGKYKHTVWMMDKITLLGYMATVALNEYLDRDNATSYFDSQSFKDIIVWCNEFAPEEYISEGDAMAVSLLVYLPVNTPFSVYNVEQYLDEYEFVGFPVSEGSGSYFASWGECFAIPAYSDNKQGAWEYIRTQLSAEIQLEQPSVQPRRNRKIPVNVQALEPLSAQVIDDVNKESENYEGYERYYEKLVDLINKTTTARNYSEDSLRDIIISSASAYFGGGKTIDEAAEIIQNRAKIYVAEKYG